MTNDKLNLLLPEVKEKALNVINLCNQEGVEILIYCTLRDLNEQAKLYRQGRTSSQIQEKINTLKSRGFGFLADIIEKVGPQLGNSIVTNAGPGESFHNYREAFDAVPIVNGKAMWNDTASYNIYGNCVRKSGLHWAGDWVSFREFPHAQLREGGNPLKIYTPEQIYNILKQNGVLS